MRWIVWLLLVVSAAVGLALLMRFNHGNVALFWPPYRLDLSVNMTVLLLLVAFGIFHLLMLGLSKAIDLPSRVRDYQSRRLRLRAINAVRDSLLAFFEGRFGRVERLVQQIRSESDLAGPAALVAARAAHRLREFERRDQWLASARDATNSNAAYLVTAAELAVEDQKGAEALTLIKSLHGRGARHIHTLRLALRAHEQTEDWDSVLQVLRQLEKRDALHPAAIQGIRIRAVRALFARHRNDAAALKRDWSALSSQEREIPELLETGAAALAAAGEHEMAWRLVELGLRKQMSVSLLATFRNLREIPARERLLRAEAWRGRLGDDPNLMRTLGDLCVEESLWGKAEEFYRLALNGSDAAQAHYRLALMYERIGRPAEAADEFRSAAATAFGEDNSTVGPAAG